MSEAAQIGSTHVEVAAHARTIEVLATIRRLMRPCADNWQLSQEITGFGDTAADAEADVVEIAELFAELVLPQYEKQ